MTTQSETITVTLEANVDAFERDMSALAERFNGLLGLVIEIANSEPDEILSVELIASAKAVLSHWETLPEYMTFAVA